MAKTLRTNVFVPDDEVSGSGTWYGPAYGNADKAPADKITNPAAWEEPVETGSGDYRFRKDDFSLGDDEDSPALREQAEAELARQAEAEQAGRDVIFGTSADDATPTRSTRRAKSE